MTSSCGADAYHFELHDVFSASVSFWSGVGVISVAALIAEVEDMQKNTVTTLWGIALPLHKIKSDCMVATTPHKTQAQLPPVCKWCKPHSDDPRCLGNFRAWLSLQSQCQTNELILRILLWFILKEISDYMSPRRCIKTLKLPRDFLCCASQLYWKSYHMYDTSISSECSISATSLSSSV